jgi:hypothetical protein
VVEGLRWAADAKAGGKYNGRKPTERAKASAAVKLFKDGKGVSDVAKALSIGQARSKAMHWQYPRRFSPLVVSLEVVEHCKAL